MRTKQEAFDIVWQAFVVEKRPQSVWSGHCRYRGPNGMKCAAGLLMADELYLSDFDTKGISVDGLPSHVRNSLCESSEFVQLLQTIHDEVIAPGMFTDHMRNRLSVLAQNEGLRIPE